jgi:hypothetical protein
MKTKVSIIILIFILLICFSCNNLKKKQINESDNKKINLKILKINGDINSLLQIDSIFSDFTIIPLETKEECLISRINKVLHYEDKFLLQDDAQKLLLFNTNGKFLYEVGKKGKGPGEFIELRDFDIDKAGNIYILDWNRILKYSINGIFMKAYPIHFSHDNNYFAGNMAIKNNDNFLIWSGSIAIKDKNKGKVFAIHEISKEGEVVKSFYPLKYHVGGNYNQFKRYKDLILIDPIFGSNIIYSINMEDVEGRYYIDFGERTLKIPVPEGFTSLSDFKKRIEIDYFHSIMNFIETDEWIYFTFFFKDKVYNVYFSKKLNKSFISKQWPLVSGRIAPWMISTSYNDKLIAFVEPPYVIEDINKCKMLNFNSLPLSVKNNLKNLAQIKSSNNPILFICSMKNY